MHNPVKKQKLQPLSLTTKGRRVSFKIIVDPPPTDKILLPFVLDILNVYARYNKNPAEALNRSNIDPQILTTQTAPIAMRQLITFSQLAMKDLDDEALGWFSKPMPWGSFSMLARGSISSPNVRLALIRYIRHHNILITDIDIRLSETNDITTITLQEHKQVWGSELARELAVVMSLRCMLGTIFWIADTPFPIVDVHFPFQLHQVNTQLFDNPVNVSLEPAGFCFDTRYLSLPNHRTETDLTHMLRHEAIHISNFRYQQDKLLENRVRRLLENPMHLAKFTAEAIAEALFISTRTLHRQLKEEGSSLQAIKDDTRKTRALYLLSHTPQTLQQIATSIGFSSEQNFNRAFQKWVGTTPNSFRSHQ